MAMEESHRRVQWVYGSTSNQELEERYDQWATEYDKDLSDDFAWNAPNNGARVLTGLVSAGASVLDAGAGTGLAGVCLAASGFTKSGGHGHFTRNAGCRPGEECLQFVSSDGDGRGPGLRNRRVRRRNQHWRLHPGPRSHPLPSTNWFGSPSLAATSYSASAPICWTAAIKTISTNWKPPASGS